MKSPMPIEEVDWNPRISLPFSSTDEIKPITDIIGQRRAVDAMGFGLSMSAIGYNLFVMGSPGTGRRRLVKLTVNAAAENAPTPPDWCYVDNFTDHRKPCSIAVPPGLGSRLQKVMSQFVSDLQSEFHTAFTSEKYRALQQAIEEEFKHKNETVLHELEAEAQANGLALIRTPTGFTFAPLKDGQVMSPEDFHGLPAAQADEIKAEVKRLEAELQHALRKAPQWAATVREKVHELNQRTAAFALEFLIGNVSNQFSDSAISKDHALLAFFKDVQQDVLENLDAIIAALAGSKEGNIDHSAKPHPFFRRYLVNLFVDNSNCEHAPIIFEDEPSLDRLIGKMEHRAEMGMLQTDFHLIRPGALHAANGGFLVIDARKLLARPAAWEALKRSMFAQKIRIESAAEMMGMASTISLEPETIPLTTKIILIGDREIYYSLSAMDPEFERLFKVAVDFEDNLDANEINSDLYAQLIGSIVQETGLTAFSKNAVIEILRHAARLASDQMRYTMDIIKIRDLLREAAHVATLEGCTLVEAKHVESAIRLQIDRLSRIPERIYETINEEIIVIDTTGEVIGQINGLSVSQIGALSFGRPTRITARVSLGRGDFVDIEREVSMGGPSHSKGVLILSSYIRSTFGQTYPLSLQASLVFEQSYGGVDGDSASLAELCALLSAIAHISIQQKFAVTGSINQFGTVQAIGGVNEKIEGFFDVCSKRGLASGQGVIIPYSNRHQLVLAPRVVDAIKAGKFSIYAVESVSEALEILTGQVVGEKTYAADSVFGLVADNLKRYDAARKAAIVNISGV